MNVTASTTITSSTEVSSNHQVSKADNKTSEKSFDEEMSKVSKENQQSKEEDSVKETKNSPKDEEKKDIQSNHKQLDDIVPVDMFSGEINFTDFKYHNESQSILSLNIQNLLNTKDIINNVNAATTIDYDSINMSESDANFFANLVQNTDMSMKSIADEVNNQLVENSQNVQKNIQVSSVLMDKLAESLNTNKPFRIDFDKDVSVIIKVNKDGSISANFIPGDKAVEQYLKNNISYLKQRFDEEDLPYTELSYSQNRQQRRNKKENENE